MGELQTHLLRTSFVGDTAYEAFATRLLGCVVEERPWGAAPAPFRKATVTALRVATPLKLLLHTLAHEDGRTAEGSDRTWIRNDVAVGGGGSGGAGRRKQGHGGRGCSGGTGRSRR